MQIQDVPMAKVVQPWRFNQNLAGLELPPNPSQSPSMLVTAVDTGLVLFLVAAAAGVGYLYVQYK